MKHMEVNKKIRIITAVVAFIVALATLTTSSVASPDEQSSSAAKGGAGDTAAGRRVVSAGKRVPEPGSAQATNQASNDPNDLRDNDRPLTGQDLIDDEFPRSWPLFGSGYRPGIHGYVKLDYLQDFSGTGDRFQFVTATIPVEGTPEAEVGGYMNMFARETRFSFEVGKRPKAPHLRSSFSKWTSSRKRRSLQPVSAIAARLFRLRQVFSRDERGGF